MLCPIRLRKSLLKTLATLGLAGCLGSFSNPAQAFIVSDFNGLYRKWGNSEFGTGATVTYSFMTTGTDCSQIYLGCTIRAMGEFLPGGFEQVIRDAFSAWQSVANINFLEVQDDGAAFNTPTRSGDIRLGGYDFNEVPGGINYLAFGYYPPINGISQAGEIFFDTNDVWKIGFRTPQRGFDLFTLAVHEIGHAIGLAHEDNLPSVMQPFYEQMQEGILQPDDIAGVQFIYGQRVTAPESVPEPSSLLGLGSVGFLACLLKKRARAGLSDRLCKN